MSKVFDDIAQMVGLPKEQYGDPDALMDAIEEGFVSNSHVQDALLAIKTRATIAASGIDHKFKTQMRLSYIIDKCSRTLDKFGPQREKSKPKTKAEFSAMLMAEYGYNQKLADECAAIVAGHGAFVEKQEG